MTKRFKIILVFLAVASFSTVSVQAATYEIDPVHSSITFKIRHLVGRATGTFDKFAGTIEFDESKITSSEISATIDVTSINSRNEKRDTHLKSADFFDVQNFAEAAYTSKYINVEAGQIHGDLTLHGVTKEVLMDYVYNGSMADKEGKMHIGGTGKAIINRKDFGINYDVAGMLGDEVELELQIEAIEKK